MSAEIYTPPMGPPQASAPRLFLRMGLEGLYRFCERQYVRLGESAIRGMFPSDPEALREASRKQAEFLAGVMGGPNLYTLKYGPPRMRSRHLAFAIDEAARREWMRCFRETLGDGSAYGLDAAEALEWLEWSEAFSAWMVNRR